MLLKLIFKSSFSPVAISILWKTVPHEILLWFQIHWAMIVQKLHDATLASLNVLEKNHDGVRDGRHKQ